MRRIRQQSRTSAISEIRCRCPDSSLAARWLPKPLWDEGDPEPRHGLAHCARAIPVTTRSRAAVACARQLDHFSLALMLAVFFAARSWFGYTAAAVAALFITFEPTLLAHGSLVTTDMALTATMFVAIVISIECVRKQSWVYFVLCGIAIGLAVTSKHSGFIVPFICLATMLASAFMQRLAAKNYLRLICGWIAACMLAFAILWGFYGFRYSALPHELQPAYDLMQPFADQGLQNTHTAHALVLLGRHRLLPEAYLAGLADMASCTNHGLPTFSDATMPRASGTTFLSRSQLSSPSACCCSLHTQSLIQDCGVHTGRYSSRVVFP